MSVGAHRAHRAHSTVVPDVRCAGIPRDRNSIAIVIIIENSLIIIE